VAAHRRKPPAAHPKRDQEKKALEEEGARGEKVGCGSNDNSGIVVVPFVLAPPIVAWPRCPRWVRHRCGGTRRRSYDGDAELELTSTATAAVTKHAAAAAIVLCREPNFLTDRSRGVEFAHHPIQRTEPVVSTKPIGS
jgi:hypothetical protein